MADSDRPSPRLSRRDFMGATAATATLAAVPMQARSDDTPTVMDARAAEPGQCVSIEPIVNGRPVKVELDIRASLLDLLRERLHLSGAKKGCDHGQCGACTVHVEGRRVAACLSMAVRMDGRRVTTIEGLSDGETLHPMQQAFIDHDALQCGYCTPGQIMAAVACVREGHALSRESIREYMSGNLCRCGAYVGIVAAIEAVVAQGGTV
ncbi:MULTISPECIES: (2Fe-2S)-binding protein [unclassified Burkholderia]|uniref:(2Fe-2S)-binding protein n=2 Tax=unclassified Burkholderia TaxID=2613784 RepID=UPI0004694C12|nr:MULTISPECIES: (2Fe-2S)-binding protein [unclassified Burkholderia]NIE85017.1 (2Fe-2S)-binding protein [Burkholderia sp. Tr-860]NIF68039.1 (2Fe-2S)-binding protein [Burkholderia sp. Cy-647]NIF72005.1 (2Fe-2S)-binding protein [Burkholderia sp. Ap-962]NIF94597.1 (2Fe-2S)-binding protein [Burkholderia sp. Ax-1720]